MLFCSAANLHVSGMRSFSREKLHYAKASQFPYLGCKGSDTVIILKWLRVLCATKLGVAVDPTLQQVLHLMLRGIDGGLGFSQGIFGHSLWLPASCARHFRDCLQQFGSSYASLAQFCVQRSLRLFAMVPKFHALMHYKFEFEMGARAGRRFLQNPAAYDCSHNEDFVGIISRQSRRIAYKHGCFEATPLRHYLLKVRCVLKRHRKSGRARPARGRPGPRKMINNSERLLVACINDAKLYM